MTAAQVLASPEAAKTLGRRVAYALVAAAALVAIGYCAGVRAHEAKLDAALAKATTQITADSVWRVTEVARTDSIRQEGAAHVAAAARVDTLWRVATRSAAALVPAIIASHEPDTTKIRELAALVDTLITRGDSLARANVTLSADFRGLSTQVDSERAASMHERADQATALATSEAETAAARRHWGLGCGTGPTVIVYPKPAAGLGVSCLVTYRR